jgi:hypothetical protein
MADQVAALCAPASPARSQSPHGPKYIVVYTNKRAQAAMADLQFKTAYPEGSVIVKEKLSTPDAKKPELLTVMVKRGKGFNSEAGDWEFFVTDAHLKITARGKDTSACISCHQAAAKQGYVFRTY